MKNIPKDIQYQKAELFIKYVKSKIPNFIYLNFFSIKTSLNTESIIIFLVNKSQIILFIQDNNSEVTLEFNYIF